MHIHTNLHEHPFLRRMTASLTGALVALTCHAVYEDTKAMLISNARDTEEVHGVAPAHTADAEARIRAFAEQLKAQRAQ